VKHTIAVLQDDIDNGMRYSPTNCAIARAANRELFRNDIHVSGGYLDPADRSWHAVLPGTALKFIPAFDHSRRPVEPFKFEIEEIPGPRPRASFGASDFTFTKAGEVVHYA
jgi:hypothetical protein